MDRRIVTPETLCETPKHGQPACGCLLQPRIELLWLPGPEEPREVLRERDRLREGGMCVVQACEQAELLDNSVVKFPFLTKLSL